MAFDNSSTKAVFLASPERELLFFLAALGQAVCGPKALHLGSLNMQFQQDWRKYKKITALLIFAWKQKNFARLSFMVRL